MVTSIIIMNIYDKIPKDSIPFLREKLSKQSKVSLARIIMVIPALRLKSPEIVFWIGSVVLGLFGVGRFMVNDKTLGIIKLLLVACSYIFLFLSIIVVGETNELASLILILIGYLCILIGVVWWVIDIFLVPLKVRKQNLEKLIAAI